MYAGTHGYLDTVPVEQVQAYEKQLLAFLHAQHAKALEELQQANELTEELEQKMVQILEEFKTVFKEA